MQNMKSLLVAIALLMACCAYASESTDQIRALVPDGITVQSIEESDTYIEILGTAVSNQEISALMRAVSEARLGDPELESIKREGGASRFHLRVRLRR